MLIITRRKGESITITERDGTQTTIVVSSFKNGAVKIGVEAPLTVDVCRTEVLQARKRAKPK